MTYLYLTFALLICLNNQALQAQENCITFEAIKYVIQLEGGMFRWNEEMVKWVAEEGTKIKKGFIALIFSIDGHKKEFYTDIIDVSKKGKTTFFMCDNGETFYVIGSTRGTTGAARARGPSAKTSSLVNKYWTEESFLNAGSFVPLVGDMEELKNLNIDKSIERLLSLDKSIEWWDSCDSKLEVKAVWDIWKERVGGDVQSLIGKLERGNTKDRVDAAENLGFLYHRVSLLQ